MEKGLEHGVGIRCCFLLEEQESIPTAIDLLGSEIDRTDLDIISTLADYAKPLIDYLRTYEEEKVLPRVILVGHSCGGAIISYALECCPKKDFEAVFVRATMVSDGREAF
ncbi:hypothetical protein IFM89_010996 [Coptis chinensis]|uniref:Uncharacterized protein n=1 Tax=Coptis chinensis TaxID=261450 RepID=A0A835MDZ0_9MAGN|nr:hypothetical protein IFM89_010996 [Coptis chinensis]